MGILPICVVIALILAALYLMARLDRARFERRFPPISDDEFMALCKPGTSREVALKVRRIVSQQLGVDYNRIYPSSSFVQDLVAIRMSALPARYAIISRRRFR